jgi:alanine-glyoxylate transaminase/serine-glyoxylate transaminase/serine-pyruvate transaminase
MGHPGELAPPHRILMGPGPSDVHPRVLRAMSTPLLGHLDPQFLAIMDEVKDMLRQVFRTKNALTIPVSGTGSSGMETCMVNLLEPGDEALICVHGYFGVRMADIAERCGAKVIRVDSAWGGPTDPAKVMAALATCKPKVLFVVHAETSTGVLQPIEEISKLAHDAGALLVVDCVTSLGGTDVRVDDWGIDAVYSGTQKCLSAPPGLSPVSFSERALKVIDARKTKVQSWYLDMTLVRSYWGQERVYHHTAPITAMYSLREALRIVLEEGLEARFERHKRAHNLLRDQLEALGFEFIVAPEYRLPMLNTVRIPAGVEDLPTRKRLLAEYNIEIGGGLGDFAGKAWRIGLMGNSATENNVNVLVSALKRILSR